MVQVECSNNCGGLKFSNPEYQDIGNKVQPRRTAPNAKENVQADIDD
jgi:hypothetical protein